MPLGNTVIYICSDSLMGSLLTYETESYLLATILLQSIVRRNGIASIWMRIV